MVERPTPEVEIWNSPRFISTLRIIEKAPSSFRSLQLVGFRTVKPVDELSSVSKLNGTSSQDAALLNYVLSRFRDATLGQAIGLFGLVVTVRNPLQHFLQHPLCFVGLSILAGALIVRAIETPRLIRKFDTLPIRTIEFRFIAMLLTCAVGWSLSSYAILETVQVGSETDLLVMVVLTSVGILGSAMACYWRRLLMVYVVIIWLPILNYGAQIKDSRLLFFMVPAGFFVFISGQSFRRMLETIEDRYRNERQSRLHFYRALNAMPIRLLILNSKLEVTFVNDGFKTLLRGEGAESMSGNLSLADIDPELSEVVHRLDTHQASQFELKLGAEEARWQLVTVRQLGETKEIIIAATDIDDRKKSEQRETAMRVLAEASSRLATMGQVAAGIAHEINNPLAIILARVERLIELDEQPDSARVETLKKIGVTGQRIAKIVRSVRALGRDGRQDAMVTVNILNTVDETVCLFEQRLNLHGVSLQLKIAPDISVKARVVEVVQILTNLISNAIDAVAAEEDLSQRWIDLSCIETMSGKIRFEISNGGTPIPDDVARKIGTPFFTTKPVGSGTGLGLAIAKNLASENGGELHLDRSVKSTCFVLTLQRAQPSKGVA